MQQSKSRGAAVWQPCRTGAAGGEAASNANNAGSSMMEIATFQLLSGQSEDGHHQGHVDQAGSLIQ